MKNGGRNELRPYGAGETIHYSLYTLSQDRGMKQCVPMERFPGFVGAPFMAPAIYTHGIVWIYTVRIRVGMSHEKWRT
jgi:hypothetical protein